MALTRINHGIFTGTKGIFLGLATAAAKAVLPAKVMPTQIEGTASAVAAIAIGKFLYGTIVCDEKGFDPVRKDLNIGNHYTFIEFFGRALYVLFNQAPDEQRIQDARTAIESFERLYLLNLVLSFSENFAASLAGHSALSLLQFSTFSFQQVALDACVSTLPLIVRGIVSTSLIT